MKTLFTLCSSFILFSFNTQASVVCDLNITIPPIEGQVFTTITASASMSVRSRVTTAVEETAVNEEAIKKCQKQGGVGCAITESGFIYRNPYEALGGVHIPRGGEYVALAKGTKSTGGRKLSDAEIAKKRLKFICGKLDSCISNALNDEKSSREDLEKLYLVKDKTRCNEVENFIFN